MDWLYQDPIRMVFINTVWTVLILSIAAIYRYIYPKKPINPLAQAIIISLFPLANIFRPGTFESGDLWVNVSKTIAFYDSLAEFHFIPQWAENLNGNLGYPLFIFTYPLPYYISSFFHFIGFSFINSVKITLGLSFILSGISMYFYAKELFGKKHAIIPVVFYLYTPYHLIDLQLRATLGELYSFVFIPLCFLGVTLLFKKTTWKNFIFTAISIALLILSHQAISLISLLLLTGYIVMYLFIHRNIHKAMISGLAILCGLAISAYYWVPVIFELQYTIQPLLNTTIDFPTLHHLLISPYYFGLLFQGPEGKLAYTIGYTQLLVIVLSIYGLIYFRKFRRKIVIYFYLLIIGLTFVMQMPFTEYIWLQTPLLSNFQFTSRILVIMVFSISILSAYILSNFSKRSIILILTITIGYTFLNWGPRAMNPYNNDTTMIESLPESSWWGEGLSPAMPRWVDINNVYQQKKVTSPSYVLQGEAVIKERYRTSTYHAYTIHVKTPTLIQENTLYFPGWIAYSNGSPLNFSYTESTLSGTMTYILDKGVYNVEFKFLPTTVRYIARIISVTSIVMLATISLFKYQIFHKLTYFFNKFFHV